MSRQSKEITIDDRRYLATQYPATRGQMLFSRLSNLVGKALSGSNISNLKLGNFNSLSDLMEQEVHQVLPLIGSALQILDPQESNSLIMEILDGVTMMENGQNRPIIFDLDFAGKYLHLFKLIKELLAFQYNDFLGGIAAYQGQVAAIRLVETKAE